MDLNSITTGKINWASLPEQELKGKTGSTLYKETLSGNIRMRLGSIPQGMNPPNGAINRTCFTALRGN